MQKDMSEDMLNALAMLSIERTWLEVRMTCIKI